MASQSRESAAARADGDDINEAQTTQARDHRSTGTQERFASKATIKDRLTILPNELLTDIIERLPVRDICRLRAQNHHLKHLAALATGQTEATQDSDRSTPTQDKDHLTALPNELLVNIVKRLPSRISASFAYKIFVQNLHMQSFVDENEGALTRDAIVYHRDRIIREHELLSDFTGLDFLDVLIRYARHYGADYEDDYG